MIRRLSCHRLLLVLAIPVLSPSLLAPPSGTCRLVVADRGDQDTGKAWCDTPGGWKEPRHFHSGGLVIWKAGAARNRAK